MIGVVMCLAVLDGKKDVTAHPNVEGSASPRVTLGDEGLSHPTGASI